MQRIIDAIIPAINILIVAYFIDTTTCIFNGNLSKKAIYLPLLLIVSMLAFQLLFGTIVGYVTKKMRIQINNKINIECLEKQASLSYQYIDNSETFMMIKKVFGEINSHINTIFDDVINVASLFVRFVSIMTIFVANGLWWIGCLILSLSIPMICVTYRNGKYIYKFYKENFPGQMEMYHSTYILKDRSVTDERTLFGFTNPINLKWKEMQIELLDKKKKVNVKILFYRYLARFVNLFSIIIIVLFMTSSVLKGRMGVGLYIAAITNVSTLIDQVISNAMNWANNLAQEKEFIKDLNIVCNYEYDADYLCTPCIGQFSVKTIEFVNVVFKYPGTERKVLNGISFKINEGGHYAFVGKNGAGKSTIIKLLTGLYDEYEGTILINERNIKDYSYEELKQMFGIIYQDYAKYDLTLKDSIKIGDINSISREIDNEFMKIISNVGLTELFNKLPDGANTLLGKTSENGQDISGGEWQRVALARLLMKKTDFMILDEPTASLDPLAESILYEQFLSISKNRTTLLISHRLGSIKKVDQIFVIECGEIIEAGTHEELINKGGLYEELYSEQKEWYS